MSVFQDFLISLWDYRRYPELLKNGKRRVFAFGALIFHEKCRWYMYWQRKQTYRAISGSRKRIYRYICIRGYYTLL